MTKMNQCDAAKALSPFAAPPPRKLQTTTWLPPQLVLRLIVEPLNSDWAHHWLPADTALALQFRVFRFTARAGQQGPLQTSSTWPVRFGTRRSHLLPMLRWAFA